MANSAVQGGVLHAGGRPVLFTVGALPIAEAPAPPIFGAIVRAFGAPLVRRYEKTKFEEEIKQMFAITGITGQVRGEVARNLLAARHSVRAVVRDVGKGKPGRSLAATW